MEGCRVKLCVEDLAAAIVVADFDDTESIVTVKKILEQVHEANSHQELIGPVDQALRALRVTGDAFITKPDPSTLLHFSEGINQLQLEIAKCHHARSATCHFRTTELVSTKSHAPLPTPMAMKVRDPDTIALIGEFLSESEDALSRADQTLIIVEQGVATPDHINSLFRVFHTIKGVAGFLELQDIQSLAHKTESLLNGCRENVFPLGGRRLDLVFDATSMMRKILNELRTAVEASAEFITTQDIPTLVSFLDQALQPDFQATDAPSAPSTPPQMVLPLETSLQASDGNGQPKGPVADQRTETKLRQTIKVDLERVDRLVEMIGELVVVEAMVVGAPEITHSASSRVRNCLSQLAKVTRDLQDVGMHMRMLPVSGVFQKMARMARDLARKSGKQVQVLLAGEQTEMDRSMVEQISDPLVHMIRNSMDHGIESPEIRRSLGKPEQGTLRLEARHEGGSVVVELSDDGRGLRRDAILAKAVSQGLVDPARVYSDDEVFSLIFRPGFSTAEKVTDISGRGVGMDVVRRNIDAMRGRLTVRSVQNQGTSIKILLPLTLAIIDGMMVACGKERYIIPTLSIIESMKPEASMVLTQGGSKEMLNMRGRIMPLLRADRLLNTKGAIQDPTQGLVVILEGVGQKVGLLVDEVIAQQQVVIKNMSEGLGETQFISGAAILSDGHVGLILNVEEITSQFGMKQNREFSRVGPHHPSRTTCGTVTDG